MNYVGENKPIRFGFMKSPGSTKLRKAAIIFLLLVLLLSAIVGFFYYLGI